jgi:hypothetical protein
MKRGSFFLVKAEAISAKNNPNTTEIIQDVIKALGV